MRLTFFGATRTVTGTCHQLEAGGARVLLDCGQFQGQRDQARIANANLPVEVKGLDAVVLSHGHLDHCGRLPLLYRMGFRGPIYCTSATAEVARIVMLDAAHIQEEDADYMNRRTRGPGIEKEPIRPLFTTPDVQAVLKLLRPIEYGERFSIKGLEFEFGDAGHILGSAFVMAAWKDQGGARKQLLFTGDVGRYNTPIIRDPAVLQGGGFDHVITESTYGTVKHADIEQVGPQFLEVIKAAMARGGKVLVPSFAIGRTQTILWYIQRFKQAGQIPDVPVFVDSPMGVEASEAFSRHREGYDEETLAAIGRGDLFGQSKVGFARSVEESKAINNTRGAAVIIASSPTCEFGRILHHLAHSLESPLDEVVFCGFTPPGTLGRRLQDIGQYGVQPGQKLRVFDRFYEVKCRVTTLHGLSAHGDGDELVRFLGPTLGPGSTFYVVHGEVDRAEGFAARLTASGAKVAMVPAQGTTVVSDGFFADAAAPAVWVSGGGAPGKSVGGGESNE